MSANRWTEIGSQNFAVLANANTAFARKVAPYLSQNLGAYLALAAQASTNSDPLPACQILAEQIGIALADSECDADEISCDFLNHPLLNLGTHSHMLLHPPVFLTYLLHQLAARAANHRSIYGQLCATVKCITAQPTLSGAAYLHLPWDVYKLYEMPVKDLTSSHILATVDISTSAIPLGITTPHYANVPLPHLLQQWVGKRSKTMEIANLTFNSDAWRNISLKGKKHLRYFKEEVTAKVLAAHLRSKVSSCRSLLFDPRVRSCYLRLRRAVLASDANSVLGRGTDLFWLKRDGRLRSLTAAEGPSLVLVEPHSCRKVEASPEELASLLERNELFPDLFLSYFVLALLPNCVITGGGAQAEYVETMRALFLEVDKRVAFLDQTERFTLQNYDRCFIDGATLVETSAWHVNLIAHLNPQTDIETFGEMLWKSPLTSCLGGMQQVSYLLGLLRRRNISCVVNPFTFLAEVP